LVSEARAHLRRIVTLLKAEEYFAVADSARFRAVQRRMTWQATRAVMLVIAIGAPIHVAGLGLLHPADFPTIVAVDGGIGAASLVGWWSLAGPARRRPELVAFLGSFGVAVAAMVLAVTGPRTLDLAIGYLMFIPPLVALMMPWRSWTEARWLAVYAATFVIFVAYVVPEGALAADDRQDLVFALLVTLVAALTGHVMSLREQIRQFAQVQALGRLQRRESQQRSELQGVYRSLEISSRIDELTGCGNRLKLEEDLRTTRGRLGRSGARIGLLEVDLDHFKGINDTYGHVAGDEVLRRVGRALLDGVRSEDAVYRFGGEEFLILLADVTGGVRGGAERLREAIEQLDLPNPANRPYGRVTLSVGGLVIGPADLGAGDDDWIGRVDAALYAAKANGRNCVVVAEPTVNLPEAAATHDAVVVRVPPLGQTP
jgi:diguanylate cyclase (GGDEF)-like protein